MNLRIPSAEHIGFDCGAHPAGARNIGRAMPGGIIAFSIALLFFASPVFASLSVLSTNRTVSAFGTSFCAGCGPNGEDEVFSNGDSISSMLAGVFSESVGSVGSNSGQTSDVTSTGISGSGGVVVGSTGNNDADSRMLVEFMVTRNEGLRLSGDVTVHSGFMAVTSYVFLRSPTGVVFSRETMTAGMNGSFDEIVQLEAGVLYTLDANATGADFEGIQSDGSWSVNLTPEPGTALLLVGSAIGLGLRRRRRITA